MIRRLPAELSTAIGQTANEFRSRREVLADKLECAFTLNVARLPVRWKAVEGDTKVHELEALAHYVNNLGCSISINNRAPIKNYFVVPAIDERLTYCKLFDEAPAAELRTLPRELDIRDVEVELVQGTPKLVRILPYSVWRDLGRRTSEIVKSTPRYPGIERSDHWQESLKMWSGTAIAGTFIAFNAVLPVRLSAEILGQGDWGVRFQWAAAMCTVLAAVTQPIRNENWPPDIDTLLTCCLAMVLVEFVSIWLYAVWTPSIYNIAVVDSYLSAVDEDGCPLMANRYCG